MNRAVSFAPQGRTQGRTQARTGHATCPTYGNSAIHNGLAKNEVWLTVRDVSHLLEISDRSVKRNCKKSVYTTKEVQGNGGLQYRILLSSLPEAAQIKYHDANIDESDKMADSETDTDWDMHLYTKAADYNRKVADKYLGVLNHCDGLKGKALRDCIEEWNEKHPDQKTSYPRVMAARKARKEEGLHAILGGYGKTRGRAFAIEELDELGEVAYRRFKGLYLNDSQKTRQDCYHAARGRALELQKAIDPSKIEELYAHFPHLQTFLRTLEKEMPKHMIFYRRYGEQAYIRKYGEHIDRDDTGIRVGEIWESDHHLIDNLWIATAEGLSEKDAAHIRTAVREMKTKLDGRHLRPWLTVWRDYKSGKILSWIVSFDAPNAERVLNCFADAVLKYGIPWEIRIDNGKDYRAHDVAGGRPKKAFEEKDVRRTESIMQVLGVKATFVWPYHGQSKRVERGFKSFAHQLAKLTKGYVGWNTANRPESLRNTIKKNDLVTFVEGCRSLDTYIETIFHRMPSNGKNHKGRSAEQMWQDEFDGYLKTIDPSSLALFRYRSTKPLSIRGGGVHYQNKKYYNDWMEQYKGSAKVYLRIPSDPDAQGAWVMHADTDEVLGWAVTNALAAPGATRTDEQREQLSEAIRYKRQIEKNVKAASAPEENPDLEEVRADIATSIQYGNAIQTGVIMHLSDPAAVGRVLAADLVDTSTGEIWEAGIELTEFVIGQMTEAGFTQARVERLESMVQAITRYDGYKEKMQELRATGTYGLPPEPKTVKPKVISFFGEE